MLIKFIVQNYKSIKDRLEFSLITTSDSNLKDTNTIPVPNTDFNVVKSALLFGANNSGKSNLLECIVKPIFYNQFKGNEENPCVFTYIFQEGNKIYKYVIEYQLDKVIPVKRLYLIKDNQETEVEINNSLESYFDSIFITEKYTNYSGFMDSLLNKKTFKKVLKVLKLTDLDIEDIQCSVINIPLVKILIRYKQFDEYIDLNDESRSIRYFIQLIMLFVSNTHKKVKPKVFILDDFANDLHPILAQFVIKLFHNKKFNSNNSQLIAATHQVKLMDKDIVRTDQLYLINKVNNSTKITRASNYAGVDTYQRLDNLYMHKGIAGVPNIDIDSIL